MKNALRFAFGKRSDWNLERLRLPRPELTLAAIGPLAIAAMCLVSWPAFSGAQGEDGSVAFGLWVGSVAIVLMAWSFLLAVRPKVLEPIFGGLDSMYRVHRWAGALAVVFMWLHTRAEPEIEGGILGVADSVADQATDLAGTAETMIYVLIALTLLRLFPYRVWRLTHKLLGIPFALSCWHFYTAEKTYANGSGWGWWFGVIMVIGLVAFVYRVVGIDMISRGRHYKIDSAEHVGTTTRLKLTPTGRPIGQRLGQFAFIKLDVPGLQEPHAFTVASPPDKPGLEFMIRHIGDWSNRLPEADLVGRSVLVEGPYGEFEPFGHDHQ
ncbi:MAG: ferric reductase-like transmembrane domain-containing protein, partial [Acidimicrobiia bacterium]